MTRNNNEITILVFCTFSALINLWVVGALNTYNLFQPLLIVVIVVINVSNVPFEKVTDLPFLRTMFSSLCSSIAII